MPLTVVDISETIRTVFENDQSNIAALAFKIQVEEKWDIFKHCGVNTFITICHKQLQPILQIMLQKTYQTLE